MAQSRKGVSVSTDTPGSGSGDNSGYWQSLAFKTGQAESTCLWAGGGPQSRISQLGVPQSLCGSPEPELQFQGPGWGEGAAPPLLTEQTWFAFYITC